MKTFSFQSFIQQVSLIFVLLLSITQAYTQVSGYQGRKTLVKFDVSSMLLDKGYGAEAELVMNRIYTFSLSYHTNQVRFRDDAFEYREIDSIAIRRQMIGFSVKRYLKSPIVAPKGFYYIFSVYQGSAALYKNQIDTRLNDFGVEESILTQTSLERVGYMKYGLGIGKQWVFGSRFLADLRTLFVWDQYFAAPFWDQFNDFPPISPGNIPPVKDGPFYNLGFSLNLGLGILLF